MSKKTNLPKDAGSQMEAHSRKAMEDGKKVAIQRYKEDNWTFLDQWSTLLREMSIPTIMIQIPRNIAKSLVARAYGGEYTEKHQRDMLKFEKNLDTVFSKYGAMFFRLNSRSPKDACLECIATNGNSVTRALSNSMRTVDDLSMINIAKAPAFICFREPLHIPMWSEFRAFVKDGKILGISQYFYNGFVFPEIEAHAEVIEKNIKEAIKQVMVVIAPHKDVVIDFVLSTQDVPLVPKMLEINPYGKSDPCMFKTYEILEAHDGSLVYATKEKG